MRRTTVPLRVSIIHAPPPGCVRWPTEWSLDPVWRPVVVRETVATSTSGGPSTRTARSSTSCSSPPDRHAAARFFRKLLKRSGRVPRRLITDRLGSYRAAHRVIMPSVVHDTTRYANNRAEVFHQPACRRESHMRRFTSTAQLSGSSQSTTSCATCSPLGDIGFGPAISDFCVRARSPRGPPSRWPDPFGAATTPDMRRGRR